MKVVYGNEAILLGGLTASQQETLWHVIGGTDELTLSVGPKGWILERSVTDADSAYTVLEAFAWSLGSQYGIVTDNAAGAFNNAERKQLLSRASKIERLAETFGLGIMSTAEYSKWIDIRVLERGYDRSLRNRP
jgi:hypothetical protein